MNLVKNLSGFEQLLIVRSRGWEDTLGELTFFEKIGGKWQKVGQPIPVVLGRSGMGWGFGLHKLGEGPKKVEGDGRSPAGLFGLGPLFGSKESKSSRMPFVVITRDLEFVDDPTSLHYNQFVDQSTEVRDWQSAEVMCEAKELYSQGIVVQHNSAPTIPGAGSAIFIHNWRKPHSPTAGCTAMAPEKLLYLINWLDEKKSPHLLQLPEPLLFDFFALLNI